MLLNKIDILGKYYDFYRHGVKQPRNPWLDGPEYVTQCPIEPGSNFTYEVIFSNEEGTLWWHAHSDWTQASVHGAIVILPVIGTTYPFPKPDEEEIIVLGMPIFCILSIKKDVISIRFINRLLLKKMQNISRYIYIYILNKVFSYNIIKAKLFLTHHKIKESF
jgi:hypothetical protein